MQVAYNIYVLQFVLLYLCMCGLRVNPYAPKSIYLNFHPLEVVSHYRDPQLQVGEIYSYLFNLKPSIYTSWCLNTHIVPNNGDLIG